MTKKTAPKAVQGVFNGAHFRAAHHFTEANGGRGFTRGVCVEAHRNGVLLTGTDGKMLIRVFDAHGSWPFKPMILAADKVALNLMKGMPRVHVDAKAAQSNRVAFKVGHNAGSFETVEGTMPDFDRVIPRSMEFAAKREDAPWLSFDPAITSAFEKAARELGARYLHLAHRGSAQPALIHIADAPAFGVLMGLASKPAPDLVLPDWYASKAKASKTPIADARENAKIAVPIKRDMRRKAECDVVRKTGVSSDKANPQPASQRTRLSDAERMKRKLERRGFRQRLRSILGRGVRLSHLTPKQAEEAKAKAREPLQRMSLAAIAKAAPKVTQKAAPIKSPKNRGILPAAPPLIFEDKHKADLVAGRKITTIRKKSPHTARFTVGMRVPVESPRGARIGETTIRKVELNPTLTPSERKGANRLYGSKAALVRITFDRVKFSSAKPSRR